MGMGSAAEEIPRRARVAVAREAVAQEARAAAEVVEAAEAAVEAAEAAVEAAEAAVAADRRRSWTPTTRTLCWWTTAARADSAAR